MKRLHCSLSPPHYPLGAPACSLSFPLCSLDTILCSLGALSKVALLLFLIEKDNLKSEFWGVYNIYSDVMRIGP